jgi:hypothetical protein
MVQLTRFRGDLAVLLRAICKNREGELLQFDGKWVYFHTDRQLDGSELGKSWERQHFHVQHARTMEQRAKMISLGLAGSEKSTPAIGGDFLTPKEMQEIGDTTVCKVGPSGVDAMREAKVVTWPQLFVIGMSHNFTAMEVFTAGILMERILTVRERPWKSDDTKAANLMKREIGRLPTRGESQAQSSEVPCSGRGWPTAPGGLTRAQSSAQAQSSQWEPQWEPQWGSNAAWWGSGAHNSTWWRSGAAWW